VINRFVIGLFLSGILCGSAIAEEAEKHEEAKVEASTPDAPAPAPPPVPPAVPAPRPPYEFVRSVTILQDQMVQGSRGAQEALPRVIAQIGSRLLAADPQVWKQPKNARAIITYTLSGGQVRVARRILQTGNCQEPERKLIEGSLAYAEGNEARAKQLLMSVNARTLPPTIAGHVALVQSILIGHDDLKQSNELLDTARILSPGTLVEETALRREIVNLSEGTDLNRFVLLSSQYLRRFKKSVYAENFRDNFYAAVTRLGMSSEQDQFDKVALAIANLEPDNQLRLYMSMAQVATLNGNMVVAKRAAEHAVAVAKEGSPDQTLAKLYEAATLILSNSYEAGMAKLKEVDDASLQKHDAELKSAILVMAKQIRQWSEPQDPPNDEEPKLNLKAVNRDATEVAGSRPVIDLAQKAILETDQLLLEGVR
jgi:chemotaxis protein MotC